MANIYEDGFITGAAAAIAALGNRIGLYLSTGVRVGTVYADTTWGSPALSGSGGARMATVTGSEVTINVTGGLLSNGAQITHYGILSGTTLLRKIDLEPVSLTVNDGAQAFPVRVTPKLEFNPTE